MVSLAKLAYRPIGLIGSMIAGGIAAAIFKLIWREVEDEDDAPSAMQSEYSLAKVLVAAAIQGAIFAFVKALINRGGARLFEDVTGKWPGD